MKGYIYLRPTNFLEDYDKTVGVVRNITSIGTSANDQELWNRVQNRPVCSNPAEYWEFFGFKFLISGKEFPTRYQNVDCFSSYTLSEWYTPEGVIQFRNSIFQMAI
jgi:hypothetical protein